MRALLVAEPRKHAVLEEVLSARGHRVSVMAEPRKAVEALRRENFPLVFLQVSSAKEHGVHLSALAGEFENTAVVALLDGDRPGELRAVLGEGAADWVERTQSRETLDARIALVERAIAHVEDERRLRAELEQAERERARLDENLHTLLDVSPDPIAVHRNDVILYGNPAAAVSFGFASAEAMVGCPIFRLIHPADHDAVRSRIEAVMETGRHAGLREERFVRMDGAELVGEAYSFRIQFDGDFAIMTVGRDLTAPRQLEKQLLHSERLATIGGMTAAIAHELKNPLTYIIFNLADLCRRLPELAGSLPNEILDGLEQRVDAAMEGVDRLKVITQDLTQFARLRDEAVKPVDLNRVLEQVLRMAAPELHSLYLKTDLSPVPTVMGNAVRLSQVFLNLLLNASHAVRESAKGQRNVQVRSSTDAAGWAVVEVHDTGVGIAPDMLGRVFEPFFTTKAQGAGTGLGLHVARTIVTRLNGEISAESELGVGTTFRVRLPPAEKLE